MEWLMDAATLGAITLEGVISKLWVVIGLGLVIFFHELGHFAVAKWCNVKVERFSLGFGPILWRFKRGETEYALSAIPFGGYVKMLGQDDMDPSQLTTDEIARDPRSYSAKSVPQRMAIISAGVIMNVITGLCFFAIAFGVGVRMMPALVGGTQVSYPAWVQGLSEGDRITRINGRRIDTFGDVQRAIALSSGPVEVEGVRPDGTRFSVVLEPNTSGPRRVIGVGPMQGLELAETAPAAWPGSAAAEATPSLPPGGVIRRVDGAEVDTFAELAEVMAAQRDESVELHVEPPPEDAAEGEAAELVEVTVPANPFRTLGLRFEIGRITAIRQESPAAKAGLQVDDRITHVDGKAVGNEIDPFELPDRVYRLAFGPAPGEDGDPAAEENDVPRPIAITVSRKQKGGERKEVTIENVVPLRKRGWTEEPTGSGIPLSIPALGVAYQVIPQVLAVDEDGPAAGKVAANSRVKKWELVLPEGAESDQAEERVVEIPLDGEAQNLPYAFWMTQTLRQRDVRLTVQSGDGPPQVVRLAPETADDWFLPDNRGLRLYVMTFEQRADDVGDAFVMAYGHTANSLADMYLTLKNLVFGLLSVTELRGPVGIFEVADDAAQAGLPVLLMFLGFLSMNLAVLNFLPIPLLDGGHMVFLIWEGVTRRKPSERVLVAATYVGMAFVLGLLGFVLYLDLFVHRG